MSLAMWYTQRTVLFSPQFNTLSRPAGYLGSAEHSIRTIAVSTMPVWLFSTCTEYLKDSIEPGSMLCRKVSFLLHGVRQGFSKTHRAVVTSSRAFVRENDVTACGKCGHNPESAHSDCANDQLKKYYTIT